MRQQPGRWACVRAWLAASALLMTSSWAEADTMYTVTDLGPGYGDSPEYFLHFNDLNTNTFEEKWGGTASVGDYTVGTASISNPGNPYGSLAGYNPFSQSAGVIHTYAGQQTLLYPVYPYQNTYPEGVNSSGNLVGSFCWNTPSDGQAFYSDKAGNYQSIAMNANVAFAINDANQIVGQATYQGGAWPGFGFAFLATPGGAMIDLNTLIPPKSGWHLDMATAINDQGDILGYGTDPNGVGHQFELFPIAPTPVPEPTTLAIFGILSLAYGVSRRARGNRRRSA